MADNRSGHRGGPQPTEDSEEPTEPIEPSDAITDRIQPDERTQPGMPDLSREEPTVPREAPTLPWSQAMPWNPGESGPDAPRKQDPLFLPVVVFVMVMLTCIGLFVYSQTRKPHPAEDPTLLAPPSPPTPTVPPVTAPPPTQALPPAPPPGAGGASAVTPTLKRPAPRP